MCDAPPDRRFRESVTCRPLRSASVAAGTLRWQGEPALNAVERGLRQVLACSRPGQSGPFTRSQSSAEDVVVAEGQLNEQDNFLTFAQVKPGLWARAGTPLGSTRRADVWSGRPQMLFRPGRPEWPRSAPLSTTVTTTNLVYATTTQMSLPTCGARVETASGLWRPLIATTSSQGTRRRARFPTSARPADPRRLASSHGSVRNTLAEILSAARSPASQVPRQTVIPIRSQRIAAQAMTAGGLPWRSSRRSTTSTWWCPLGSSTPGCPSELRPRRNCEAWLRCAIAG